MSRKRPAKSKAPVPAAAARPRRPLEKLLPLVLVLLVATVGWRAWQGAHSPARLLKRARQAFDAADDAEVEAIARQLGPRAAAEPALVLLAAQAAARQGHAADAIAYYDQVPADAGEEAAGARCAAGDLWRDLGQPSQAEREYRQALVIAPASIAAHERLAKLLAVEGRAFESLPHFYELLRGGEHSYVVLLLAGEHSKTTEMPDELARWRSAAPADPAPLIGLARIELGGQKARAAEQLLREAIAKGPYLIEAHALLGQILLQSAESSVKSSAESELAAWLTALPPEADEHPDVWAVRGGWARREGQLQAAARCFWEALRRDSNHQLATLQLSQLLNLLDEERLAEDLSRRAVTLAEFSMTLNMLYKHPDDAVLVFRAARLAESLGRLWEARGWNQFALSKWPNADWARDALDRILPPLNELPPPTVPQLDPGVRLDLSHYPLPREPAPAGDERGMPQQPSEASPRFADVASQAGIDFTYFCGREPGEPRDRIFQSLGGGVAVLDFDLDCWPDLYFTQGCRWPPQAEQTEHLDAIYRNLGARPASDRYDARNARKVGIAHHEFAVGNAHATTRQTETPTADQPCFADVTGASGLGDDRFSQGATVGDFDNDGFPDLYVANIGVNRLYHNNGDGTFSEVTDAAGITHDRWTTSCLLADLNGDGLPDIYDVNYVQGPDVYERTCGDAKLPRTCAPTLFEPAPDTFYLNLGDGRFEELGEPAGLRAVGGNGLGVVAGDFSGTGRLNLFVANDQDANFYFVNETAGAPRFIEQGLLSGLAYNGEGKAFASMGVAAGDVNGDGRIDLAVSNFLNESITLYLQEVPDSFTDASGPAGLRAPSFAMLGFGAQFLDGELDGSLDLVMTNGHVHEHAAQGVSFAMRPQYFRNQGGGRFEELPAKAVGDYFDRACFGRGLARLDFNRDGLDDFAVSALESPAALVCNQTPKAGHFLSVKLIGSRSSRDAIGAVVSVVVAGKRRQTQWLTAGDGFQASNERRLTFGLGDAARVERLVVSWPSGREQEFVQLPGDRELLLIEDRSEPYILPR